MSQFRILLACAAVAACDRGAVLEVDAAVTDATETDAAVTDATETDAAEIDAIEVDGATDARVIDAAPTEPTIGELVLMAPAGVSEQRWIAHLTRLPGTQHDVIFCALRGNPTEHAGIRRTHYESSEGPTLPEIAQSSCRGPGIEPLGPLRIAGYVWPEALGGNMFFLLGADVASNIPVDIHGTGSPLVRIARMQRIDGGVAVFATRYTDPEGTAYWEVSDSGTITRSRVYAQPHYGIVLPRSGTPATHTLVSPPSSLVTVDIDTDAVLSTAPTPLDSVADVILDRAEQAWVLGRVGTSAAVAPVPATVPTLVPWEWSARDFDSLGRLVIARVGSDKRSIDVCRVDASLYDGLNGSSRLDAAFGTTCSLRLDFFAPCGAQDFPCLQGTRELRRIEITVDGDGHLVVLGELSNATSRDTYFAWFDLP